MTSGGQAFPEEVVEPFACLISLNPHFPAILFANRLQKAVVFLLVRGDVTAQVKYGDVQQSIALYHQEVEDTAGATIPVPS